MKTQTFVFSPWVKVALFGSAFMLLAVAFLALPAFAAVPSISPVIQDAGNSSITSASIGSLVHDSVTIASSTATTTPSGTVDFLMYPNMTCTGASTTQGGVALVAGVAESNATTVPSTGLSYKVHYSGEGSDFNSPVDGACQPLTANSASVTVATNLSTTTAQAGSIVHASSSIAGATANAGGTVAYTVFTNNSCTAGATNAGVKAVTNGVALDSNSVQFNFVGNYYWQSVYSGDSNNNAATSTCLNGVLAITATTTPPVATSTPTISTSLSTTSIPVNVAVPVTDSATLTGESSTAGGSVAYNVYSNSSCTTDKRSAGSVTVTNGNVPNSNTLTFNAVGTYYWQAVYSGDLTNTAATSSCGSEVLTVTATTTTPVTPPVTGSGVVQGTVFNDLNKNDTMDSGEQGLAGWTILLHIKKNNIWWDWNRHDGDNSSSTMSATTDGNGHYSFTGLQNGNYKLEEIIMPGWKQTSNDPKVRLSSSTPSATVDFSNIQKNISTSTNHGGNGHNGNDGDNDDNSTSTDNGGHNGHDGNNGNNGNGGSWDASSTSGLGQKINENVRGLGSSIVNSVFSKLHLGN